MRGRCQPALAHAADGIQVNCVCPGFVETDMWSVVAREQDARLTMAPCFCAIIVGSTAWLAKKTPLGLTFVITRLCRCHRWLVLAPVTARPAI